MPRDLGDAFINISPNSVGFREKLLADIKAAMVGVNPEVPLTPNTAKLDAAIAATYAKIATLEKATSGLSLDADAKALTAKISGLTAQAVKLANALRTMKAGVNATAVQDKILAIRAQVTLLENDLTSLKMDADDSALLAKLAVANGELEALLKERDLVIGADDTAALSKIGSLKALMAELQQSISSIKIDVNDTQALAKLTGFIAQADALTGKINSFTVDANIAPALGAVLALKSAVNAFSAATMTKQLASVGIVATEQVVPALTEMSRAGLLAGIGLGGLGAKTQLFAGALTSVGLPAFIATASALHIITDSILEVAAEVLPAGAALAAFGIAAAPVIGDVATQMQNVFVVSRALNQNIYPLTGGFTKLASAVQPEVYQLFGQALVVVGKNMGGIQSLAVATGKILDDLGARIAAALTSGSLDKLIKNGPEDLAQLGDLLGNIFGIIGNVLQKVPGYAQQIFGALDAVTGAIEHLTGSGLGQWLLGIGLAGHGFLLWAGLAGTAAVGLGNALLGLGAKFGLVDAEASIFDALAFGQGVLTAIVGIGELGAALVTLAGGEAIAAAATGALGGVLDALGAVNPIVWIAAAIGGLVALGLWLANAATQTTALDKSLIGLLANSSLTTFPATYASTIGQLNASNLSAIGTIAGLQTQIKNLGAGLDASSQTNVKNAASISQQSSAYQALNQQVVQQKTVIAGNNATIAAANAGYSNYKELLKAAGGNLGILNQAGITSTNVLNDHGSALAQDIVKVEAAADAYKALGLGVGESAAGLNAANIPLKENAAALATMTQNEAALLGTILGGQTAFNSFQQSISGTTAKFVSPSGLADAAKLAGGNLTGLSQQSLAFSNTLYSQSIPALQTLTGNLQKQGISQTNLTKVVATGAGQITAFTGHNTEANAVIVSLINNALGPGTVSLKTLNTWIGKNSTSLGGMNAIVAQSTIKAGTLAGVLQNDLNAAFAASLLKSSGATAAISKMTDAIVNGGVKTTAYKSARDQLIADMEKTGLSSQAAKAYVDKLTASVITAGNDGVTAGNKIDDSFIARLTKIHQDTPAVNKDVGNFTNAVLQTGDASVRTASARDKLIADLEQAGVKADTARRLVNGLQNQIDAMHGKTVTVGVHGSGSGTITIGTQGLSKNLVDSIFLRGLASGGQVGGSGNRDSVMAMLTPGEVVIPKGMVAAGAVDHLRGKLPGFAAGGLVDLAPSAATSISNDSSAILTAQANAVTQQLIAAIKKAQQALVLAQGGPLGSGSTAGEIANGTQLYNYLLNNLFGGNRIAAAGATASIWGESTWDPFAQGTGGRGLIGWTPPGTISDAAFSGGMATQLPAILAFVRNSGDAGVIREMESASSVFEAANEWGVGVERFGINDVHPEGIALATAIAGLGSGQSDVRAAHGGLVPGNGIIRGFATGGRVAAQNTERNAFAAIRSAVNTALVHPAGYFLSHKTSLAGELATLTERQAAEQIAYAALAGKGLTKSNLSKFATKAREEITTTKDKFLSTAEPSLTKRLAAALTAVSTAGSAPAVKAALAAPLPAKGGSSGSSGAGASGPLTHAQYLADFAEVHGLPLSTIRKSRHLEHIWHLLHLQHLADLGMAGGGQVMDSGGWLPTGPSLVYNHTGSPEHLTPDTGQNIMITLEAASSGNEFDKFMLEWLRGHVRVKGGGSVQKAFGRPGMS